MASIDREQVAADWANRGFSCDIWFDPPGRRWEDFTHVTDEPTNWSSCWKARWNSRSLGKFATLRSETSF